MPGYRTLAGFIRWSAKTRMLYAPVDVSSNVDANRITSVRNRTLFLIIIPPRLSLTNRHSVKNPSFCFPGSSVRRCCSGAARQGNQSMINLHPKMKRCQMPAAVFEAFSLWYSPFASVKPSPFQPFLFPFASAWPNVLFPALKRAV